MEIKLSIDVSLIFNDIRKKCYIIIDKKSMKIVADVQNKIADLLEIDDFWLSQDDHCLLPKESISVIDLDTELIVIPKETDSSKHHVKKKKKKIKVCDTNEEEEEVVKKKRKKSRSCEENVENEKGSSDDNKPTPLKTKPIQKNNELVKKVLSFQEHLNRITMSKEEITQRPPNRVQIIKINNNSINDTSTALSTEDVSTNNYDSTSKDETSLMGDTKVKRKRTRRKRKPRVVEFDTSLNSSSIEPTSITLKPKVHIKFEDENNISNVEEEPKENKISYNNLNGGEKTDNEPAPMIIQSPSPKKIIESENVIKNDISNLDTQKCDTFDSDFISKQPPVDKNVIPKLGDIYAFRTLVIGEDYSPGFSGFIVGSVIDFNVDSRSVTFKISQGNNELSVPNGKFFIEDGDDEENEKLENDTHTFEWDHLLNPRLLSATQ